MFCNKLIKKFFENIFDDNPFEESESPQASGSNIEQTAKDNGNKAVKNAII